ncbi:hypothetical protein EMCRGX_G029055 [Ephydatia muelleri]
MAPLRRSYPSWALAGVDDDQYPPQRKVFAMLRHMFEHHIDTYDFFMRADDDAYVKSDGLRDLLQSVNPAQDIYMGSPGFGREPTTKTWGSGAVRPPTSSARERGKLFWTDYNSTVTSEKLYASKAVKFALTLHPIKDPSIMVQMHLYLQQLRVAVPPGGGSRSPVGACAHGPPPSCQCKQIWELGLALVQGGAQPPEQTRPSHVGRGQHGARSPPECNGSRWVWALSSPYWLNEGFVAQDPSFGVTYMLAVSLQKTHPSPRAVRYVARVFLPLLGPGLAHYQLATEPLGKVTLTSPGVLNNATRSTTLEESIQSYSESVTFYHADELYVMDAISLVAKVPGPLQAEHHQRKAGLLSCALLAVQHSEIPNHTPSLGDAGFFLHHSYEVACVYTSDYLEYAGPHKKTKLQLVDQLVSSNFYVMRALKPYLFRPFEYGRCSKLDGQQKKDCIIAQVEAIGSRRLLSSLVAASYHVAWPGLCVEIALDPLGHHAVSCKRGGDVVSRHNKLRDVLTEFSRRAHLGVQVEMGSNVTPNHSHTRPADLLVPNWVLGKPAAFDLSVTSSLNPTIILEASETTGAAARTTEQRKHCSNDAKCDELAWVCVPLVVESYGAWGKEALESISQLAARLATCSSKAKSVILTELYGCLHESPPCAS